MNLVGAMKSGRWSGVGTLRYPSVSGCLKQPARYLVTIVYMHAVRSAIVDNSNGLHSALQ